MFKIYGDRRGFFQWDKEQKLIVNDNTVNEVHFCNGTDTCSLVCKVYEAEGLRLVNIPNILLCESWDIRAYAYCGECYTKVEAVFKVYARSKPADYVYTETEIKSWEKLNERIGIVENDINEIKESLVKPPTINPVFSNNSWEQIATAAKLGIAQNYWNVGDYKDISIDTYELERLSSQGINILINPKLFSVWGLDKTISIRCSWKSSSNPDGWYIVIKNLDSSVVNGGVSYTNIESVHKLGVYPQTEGDGYVVVKNKQVVKNYPVQIIGFNHDKVTDKLSYGRDRAGITLQLGASRDVYGDNKAAIFDMFIDGIMTADGKHYKSPNKVLTDYTEGATNWADGGFRVALQDILKDSDIADYVVKVQKYTSQYYNNTNKYYAPMLTHDKVFLPSEYEIFGLVDKAPAPEGKQYEFYEDGYSKFIWSEELLNGSIAGARIWLRSAAGEKVNKDEPNSIYGTSIYLGVYSLNPLNISYMPSGVASGDSVPAYIAPCFCL